MPFLPDESSTLGEREAFQPPCGVRAADFFIWEDISSPDVPDQEKAILRSLVRGVHSIGDFSTSLHAVSPRACEGRR